MLQGYPLFETFQHLMSSFPIQLNEFLRSAFKIMALKRYISPILTAFKNERIAAGAKAAGIFCQRLQPNVAQPSERIVS